MSESGTSTESLSDSDGEPDAPLVEVAQNPDNPDASDIADDLFARLPGVPAGISGQPFSPAAAGAATDSPGRGTKRSAGVLEEGDADTCVICFEPFTSTGSHRLVSLRCGHVFGELCAEKCVKDKKRCPQCNSSAKVRDIRVLYVQSVRAVDNTEEERLRKELDEVKQAFRRKEEEFNKVRMQVAMYQDKIAQLEVEKLRLAANREGPSTAETIRSSTNLIPSWHATIEVCKNASCRVMTFCPVKRLGVVSMVNSSTLFVSAKFGVKKVNFEELRSTSSGEFFPLHAKEIRDMAFNPKRDSLLLTASLDQTAKLTDLRMKKISSTITVEKPIWSCCWNGSNSDQVYLGLQTGILKLYDVRNTEEPVEDVTDRTGAGILNLTYVQPDTRNASFPSGGILAGRLKSCDFYTHRSSSSEAGDQPSGHVEHSIVPVGSAALNSICFEPTTRHLLLSKRGAGDSDPCDHSVCQISSRVVADARVFSTVEIASIRGSRSSPRLGRSMMFANPFNPEAAVVVADHDGRFAGLWDAGSGRCLERVSTTNPMLDACLVSIKDDTLLPLLTANGLSVYKLKNRE